MPQFHETGYGRAFYEHQLPTLLKTLQSIASSLGKLVENTTPVDLTVATAVESKDDLPAWVNCLSTEQEREAARELYCNEHGDQHIQVDSDARASRSRDGVWVQGWLWVSNEDAQGTGDGD